MWLPSFRQAREGETGGWGRIFLPTIISGDPLAPPLFLMDGIVGEG